MRYYDVKNIQSVLEQVALGKELDQEQFKRSQKAVERELRILAERSSRTLRNFRLAKYGGPPADY